MCVFLALGVIISLSFVPAWADRPIFLQPHDTGKNTSKSDKNVVRKPKSTIFLRKKRDKTETSVRFNRRSTVSSVFRNDLAIYKDLKGLDLMKLTSVGGEPANSDELQKIAAAHRIPTMKAIIKLQKDLAVPAPLPVVKQAKIEPVTQLSDWIGASVATSGSYAGVGQARQSNVKTVYKPAEKKSSRVWKLFGR